MIPRGYSTRRCGTTCKTGKRRGRGHAVSRNRFDTVFCTAQRPPFSFTALARQVKAVNSLLQWNPGWILPRKAIIPGAAADGPHPLIGLGAGHMALGEQIVDQRLQAVDSRGINGRRRRSPPDRGPKPF